MNALAISGTRFADASPLRPGEIIAGKYRVERVLGAGGMGVVVVATHLQLRHPVAIKVLAMRSAECEPAVPRFLQEARAAARIQNEHVVRVFDVGVLPDGPPFIAMEFLEGNDLGRLLEERGPLPLPEALECLLQACEGISEAHAVGVVHRDLKPANLVRCERPGAPPLVKVVDFGISKLMGTAASSADMVVTAPHEILGSPFYASPEQIRSSRHVDGRADIWALGAVCYAMLAGEPPFQADTFSRLCTRIIEARAVPLDRRRPDVPPSLAAVIERCLAKEPEDRFQTVAELACALAPFAPPRALVHIERIVSLARGAPLAVVRDPEGPIHTVAHVGSAGVLRWAVASAVLALATAAVLLASRGGSSVATAGTSSPAARAPESTTQDTAIRNEIETAASSPPAATPPAESISAAPLPSAPVGPVRARPSRTSGFGGML